MRYISGDGKNGFWVDGCGMMDGFWRVNQIQKLGTVTIFYMRRWSNIDHDFTWGSRRQPNFNCFWMRFWDEFLDADRKAGDPWVVVSVKEF